MKRINAEYDRLFEMLKDVHQTRNGSTYTSWQPSNETADQFKNLIETLINMDGIVVEIIGCFVWLTGNTELYREDLKSLKFQWHNKKQAWYLMPEDYKSQYTKYYDLDEIRAMYDTSGMMIGTGTDNVKRLTLKF